jgi:uncharacterized protein YecE (DUF72 family)
MERKIRVGTSGYTFDDWKGLVYPRNLKGSALPYYARMFDCVEVNTTFYRVPSPILFERMLKYVPGDFVFLVKVPKEMTHDRARLESVVIPFARCVTPLIRAKQLAGLLVQFPFSFKLEDPSLAHLEKIADALAGHGIPINVEFRHDSWLDESVYRFLKERGLGFVNVDLPELNGLPERTDIVTSNVAYYRLHGRSKTNWWRDTGNPHDRYDYLYSEEQLDEWADKARGATSRADVAYVLTNNCRLGQSVISALMLAKKLDLPAPTRPPGLPEEMFEPTRDELIERLTTGLENARAAMMGPDGSGRGGNHA